jgi:divalent metal cation (Fe/Co/Zn/Cd) transporter
VATHPDPARASAERTLLVALLLSLWAPLATGLAVLLSHSTTPLADFVRRSAELVAVALSWAVLRRAPSVAQRVALEHLASCGVALTLAFSGVAMVLLVGARWRSFEPGGDVRLGLVIAGLGLVTNAWFWRRFSALAHARADALIHAQRRLYRAKVAVDASVIIALATIGLVPGHPVTRWLDLVGSSAVALHLGWSAWRTLPSAARGPRRPARLSP